MQRCSSGRTVTWTTSSMSSKATGATSSACEMSQPLFDPNLEDTFANLSANVYSLHGQPAIEVLAEAMVSMADCLTCIMN